jgi:L-arabinose isomerase
LPKLPVARAVWECRPCFKTACAAWIYAGGVHHTGFSYAVTTEHMEDFAEIAGLELVVINDETELPDFKQQLRYNDIYYHLARIGASVARNFSRIVTGNQSSRCSACGRF